MINLLKKSQQKRKNLKGEKNKMERLKHFYLCHFKNQHEPRRSEMRGYTRCKWCKKLFTDSWY